MSGQRFSAGIAGATAAQTLELVDAAERSGVDGVWIGDLAGAPDRGDSYWTMVAGAAATRTRYLRLGVVLRLTDPATGAALRLAEDLAMIDNGSDGRLDVLLALDGDAEREERARLLFGAWRGWEVADGRRFPVTPRPAQPAIPRLVLESTPGDRAAERLAAGRAARRPDRAGDAGLERRLLIVETPSVEALVGAHTAAAVASLRARADGWRADEVALWLDARGVADISREMDLAGRVLARGLAGGDDQWEMLTVLGARAAGLAETPR